MEQSLEMMRKRHAYFTRLIKEHDIHTAREFCDRFHELFEMLGTDLWYENGVGVISIIYEDYEYEDYTITDGEDGGMATISPVVEYKYMFTNNKGNIFKMDHLDY